MSRRPLDGPAAFVFDLDGLLIDTEVACLRTTQLLVRRHGGGEGPSRAEYGDFVGVPLEISYAGLRRRFGLKPEVPQLLREREDALLAAYEAPKALPGAEALVRELHGRGYPLAIASSAPGRLVDAAARALPFGECFAAAVSADSPGVAAPKPSPDGYLVACAALGVDPARVTALEDSPTGAEAALAAGLATLVIPNEFTRGRRFPPGAVLAESLDAVRGALAAQAA